MSKSILSISVDNLLYNRWMNREKQRVSMRKQAVGNWVYEKKLGRDIRKIIFPDWKHLSILQLVTLFELSKHPKQSYIMPWPALFNPKDAHPKRQGINKIIHVKKIIRQFKVYVLYLTENGMIIHIKSDYVNNNTQNTVITRENFVTKTQQIWRIKFQCSFDCWKTQAVVIN